MTSSPPPETQPRVLVVDDDDRLRGLLEKYLSSNGFSVSSAADAGAAENLIAAAPFDIIVADRMMPGRDGIQMVKGMREAGISTPVIMLTAIADVGGRIDGFSAGADDYLSKPFEPKELLLRMKSILKRTRRAGGVAALGDATYDPRTGVLSRGGRLIKLTTAEKNVMNYLIGNANRAVAREEIAGRLGLSGERGVDVAVARLRRKIEREPNVPQIILTIRNSGYKLVL